MSNDAKILKLQKEVEAKREELKTLKKKPVWKTNATIVIGSTRYNLNVIKEVECSKILSYLIASKKNTEKANKILGIETPIKFDGFTYSDWEHDLVLRCDILKIKQKEDQLKHIESVLEQRLSEDAKAEKDITAVMDALKNM
jgi:hypothetical protein